MRSVDISIVTCDLPPGYEDYPQIHLTEGTAPSDISEHLWQLARQIRLEARIRASTEDRGGGWGYDDNDDSGWNDEDGGRDDGYGDYDEIADECDDDEYEDSEGDWDGDIEGDWNGYDEARSSSASQGEDTLVQSEDDDVYGSVGISVRGRLYRTP
jgi:hypothetical protein